LRGGEGVICLRSRERKLLGHIDRLVDDNGTWSELYICAVYFLTVYIKANKGVTVENAKNIEFNNVTIEDNETVKLYEEEVINA